MKLEALKELTVSESTKEWVRKVIELDNFREKIRQQLIEQLGSEEEAEKAMSRDFRGFTDIHNALIHHMSMNISENISDICSTQI